MCCLLLGGGTLGVFAQNDDYNPTNPAEPNVIDFCKLTVSADPAEGAYVSGGGRYKVGSGGRVYISTSARNTEDYTYTFQYWTLNGEIFSYNASFSYTPQKGEMHFVAHYQKKEVVYDPTNPADPSGSTIKRKFMLYITSSLEGACSFNQTSGVKREAGKSIYLNVYPNPYFRFDGWSVNGVVVSRSTGFNYTMPSAETTIEALFTEIPYDPENPIDPTSPSQGQENIDTRDPQRQLVTLTIGNAENRDMDRTRIVFNDTKQLAYEPECDAAKFISDDADYQLYSLDRDNTLYQINERPVNTGVVPLGIIVKNEGSVTISTSRLDCEDAILVDKILSVQHRLITGSYTFSSAAGTFNNRFELKVPGAIKGDVNGDGIVNVSDAIQIINAISSSKIDLLDKNVADMNSDGVVNVSDAIQIINVIIK